MTKRRSRAGGKSLMYDSDDTVERASGTTDHPVDYVANRAKRVAEHKVHATRAKSSQLRKAEEDRKRSKDLASSIVEAAAGRVCGDCHHDMGGVCVEHGIDIMYTTAVACAQWEAKPDGTSNRICDS